MKIVYLIIVIIGLYGCNSEAGDNADLTSPDTLPNTLTRDTGNVLVDQHSQPVVHDSVSPEKRDTMVGYYWDSLFIDVELQPKEISETDFRKYIKNYKMSCALDSTGFAKETGLYLSHYCGDICESYLVEHRSGKKMVLPSGYDQGILGIPISPSCKRFIVYSSYDGPDYTEFYENRAEICGFTIANTNGLKGIQPFFKYGSKDWSIDTLFWINDNALVLKTYEGSSSQRLRYRYFKAKINVQ